MGRCELCRESVPDPELIDHLRVVHAEDVEPVRWPDGSPVVVDHTLKPEDF